MPFFVSIIKLQFSLLIIFSIEIKHRTLDRCWCEVYKLGLYIPSKMDVPELIRKEGLRRRLSHKTIKTYRQCVKQFFRYCEKDPKKINKKDIKDFLDKFVKRDAPGNTINVYLNALKFFYNEILNKRLMVRIRFSKTPKNLPTVLTKDEVVRLFCVVSNPKHKLMLKLMYSAGLRVSELVNLKKEHFEFDNNYGWVRHGKGNKDRLFIVAQNIKFELIKHIEKYCLYDSSYLFVGRNGHLSVMSVQKIVKSAGRKAGIRKNIHPHTLRHSFATHVIENGYDVASVQSLLGHTNAQTTMTYVHMANPNIISVKSPYDSLACGD